MKASQFTDAQKAVELDSVRGKFKRSTDNLSDPGRQALACG
jgi:hypothetical protein